MEIARVLFTDIVGYSKMQAVGQLSLVEELNGLISEENQFRQALEQETVITTGDGMALAFFSRREAPRPQRRTNRGYLCFRRQPPTMLCITTIAPPTSEPCKATLPS
jgi:hypothetical protein